MGKLPTSILYRPSLAAAGLSSSSSSSSCLPQTTLSPTATAAQQNCPARLSTPRLRSQQQQQRRHASFVARPRRPYTFTQLVQLSDGSTFTVRTTSPQALYKSAKDSRNHILWQPSEKSLRNLEVDEAGKLAAFRERYGNAWNLDGPGAPAPGPVDGRQPGKEKEDGEKGVEGEKQAQEKQDAAAATTKGGDQARAQKPEAAEPPAAAATQEEDAYDSLVDLISMYAKEDKNTAGGLSAKAQARKDKAKKK